jgi:hypothetical protein
MEVLLALDKLKDAEKLTRKCHRVLCSSLPPEDQGLVASAFASFCGRVGGWDKAIAAWELIPLDDGLLRDRLIGIVEVISPASVKSWKTVFEHSRSWSESQTLS